MNELKTEYFKALAGKIVDIMAVDFYIGHCPEDRERYTQRAMESLKPLEDELQSEIDALNERIKTLEAELGYANTLVTGHKLSSIIKGVSP